MSKIVAFASAALLAVSLLTPLAAGAEDGPLVVGTDAYGDWGNGGDNAAVGHTLGQDLVDASITQPAADRVDFTMRVTFLPSPGGVPEASRYTWNMDLLHFDPETQSYGDPDPLELDGKFTNYSRGTCDPSAGTCPPPRDPGSAPFAVRGNCTVNDANVTTCQEIALVHGTFSPATKTITVPVPTDLLKLGPCTAIMPGSNLFGGSVSAAPSAYFTSSAMPLDFMMLEGIWQAPSADGTPCPELPEYF